MCYLAVYSGDRPVPNIRRLTAEAICQLLHYYRLQTVQSLIVVHVLDIVCGGKVSHDDTCHVTSTVFTC